MTQWDIGWEDSGDKLLWLIDCSIFLPRLNQIFMDNLYLFETLTLMHIGHGKLEQIVDLVGIISNYPFSWMLDRSNRTQFALCTKTGIILIRCH